MRIYVAIQRRTVATLSHVRLCTLPRVFLVLLVLLVSTHFNDRRKAYSKLFRKIERQGPAVRWLISLRKYLIDQAVRLRLVCRHIMISIGIPFDRSQILTRIFR